MTNNRFIGHLFLLDHVAHVYHRFGIKVFQLPCVDPPCPLTRLMRWIFAFRPLNLVNNNPPQEGRTSVGVAIYTWPCESTSKEREMTLPTVDRTRALQITFGMIIVNQFKLFRRLAKQSSLNYFQINNQNY